MNTSIWATMKPMRAYERVDAELFRTAIEPRNEPAILRDLVGHWPAVKLGRESPEALARYLQAQGSVKPIAAFVIEPRARGRFFYRDDLQGLNFQRQLLPIAAILQFLLKELRNEQAPGLYAGTVPVPEYFPGLLPEHRLGLIDPSIDRQPSLWIGNRSRVAAHWDQPQNIACAIHGRRRYTLFPIEQAKHLYFGPLDRTPAGAPISLVDFHHPDFERQPNFRRALEHALVAELDPADAIYIPSLWIHHAESLDAFGLMMNFWWHPRADYTLSPFQTLLHSLLTLRDLPPAERAGWRSLFELYVFGNDDPMAHLPMETRGVFASMTPARARELAIQLQQALEHVKHGGGPR